MFEPWADEAERTLNPKLLEMHKQYVDACIDLGIDGIRADVARAKPPEFWDVLIIQEKEIQNLRGLLKAIHMNVLLQW